MNKYEVLGIVGEGAYGVVLKCRHKESSEIVAIKKFKSLEDEATHSTLREVKILKMLKHEKIIQLKEAFRRKGRLYLVFEYIERNLLEILEENPSGLALTVIQSVMAQLCAGIDYCHKQEVIHRDIKPENLLISNSFQLKLCDFGFARAVQSKSNLTDYVATRWYRSPELLIGDNEYGKPLDMWSIGCIMAEMIDGLPLFPGESDIDQLYLIKKVLGPLTPSQEEVFAKNPQFIGFKIPEILKLESLELKFSKIDRVALDFLSKLLAVDPEQRITASQALSHPYLNNCGGKNLAFLMARSESTKPKGKYFGPVFKNKRLLLISNTPTDMKKPLKNKEDSQSPSPVFIKENQFDHLNKTNKSTSNNEGVKFGATPQIIENESVLKFDRQRSKEFLRNPDQLNERIMKIRKTQIEEPGLKFSPILKPFKKKSKPPNEGQDSHLKTLKSSVFSRFLPKPQTKEDYSSQVSAKQLPQIPEKNNKNKLEGAGLTEMCGLQAEDLK